MQKTLKSVAMTEFCMQKTLKRQQPQRFTAICCKNNATTNSIEPEPEPEPKQQHNVRKRIKRYPVLLYPDAD